HQFLTIRAAHRRAVGQAVDQQLIEVSLAFRVERRGALVQEDRGGAGQQHARKRHPVPDAKWADLKQASKDVAGELDEGNAARAAAMLEAASSSLARNPDVLKDFVFAVASFVWKSLQARCNWRPADDSRFMKLADGIYKHALETGVEPPRGGAMSKRIAEIDPQLVERFLSHYEEGHRASGERGRAFGDLLLQLTRQIA
ncbi:hypothetical protein PPH41_24145, partial [Burkholderia gladioli]|nr:hypothetical protein [Burkholderia gladioli]